MRTALVLLVLLAACHRPSPRHSDDDPAPAAEDASLCGPTRSVSVKRASFPGTDEGAVQLVEALSATPDAAALAASLRPDSEDYAAVFDSDFAGRMERFAAAFWDVLERAAATNLAGMTLAQPETATAREIILFSLPPARLQHPGSALCGDAYTKSGIEKHFHPNVTVYCFGFRMIDQDDLSVSLADALVFVRGHWAIFPRPNDVPSSVPVGCPARVVTDPAPLAYRVAPPPPRSASGPDAARAVLSRMLVDPATARAALAKLEPSLADVRALYKEPAATRLFQGMKPNWARFRSGGNLLGDFQDVLPSPRDRTVHIFGAPADVLGTAASPCPTGYREVRGDLQPNAYVYCWTFAEIGLGGIGMDGLAYVRGHWVLVPRPWETLGK